MIPQRPPASIGRTERPFTVWREHHSCQVVRLSVNIHNTLQTGTGQADPILCMDVFLSPLNGSEAHGATTGRRGLSQAGCVVGFTEDQRRAMDRVSALGQTAIDLCAMAGLVAGCWLYLPTPDRAVADGKARSKAEGNGVPSRCDGEGTKKKAARRELATPRTNCSFVKDATNIEQKKQKGNFYRR